MRTFEGLWELSSKAFSTRGMYSTFLPGSMPNEAVTISLGWETEKKKSGENIIVSASSIMMYFSILAGVRCYNCHYSWQISLAIILLPGAGSNITCAPLTCMWWFHRKQEACNTLGVFLQKLRHFSLDFGAATSTPDIHTLLHLSAE